MNPTTPVQVKALSTGHRAGEVRHIPISELATVDLATLQPLREPARHHGQRHRGGWHAWRDTGSLEPFESLLEWQWMRHLEFDVTVRAVHAQRIFICGDVDHFVDFIIELHDGTRIAADVRHSELQDCDANDIFSETRDSLKSVGLAYIVLDEKNQELLDSSRDYLTCRQARSVNEAVTQSVLDSLDSTPVDLSVLCQDSGTDPTETLTAVRHLIHQGTIHAERLSPLPDGLSADGELWLQDRRRTLALRDHAWTAERWAGATSQDQAPVDVQHTKDYPVDAADLDSYDPVAAFRACAAYDALAQYAEATNPEKYPRLAQYSRSLPNNPLLEVDRPTATKMLKTALETSGYGAEKASRYRLLNKAEEDGSARVLIHGNRGGQPSVDEHPHWYDVAVDHLRKTSDGPTRLKKSRIFEISQDFHDLFPLEPLPSRDRRYELLDLALRDTRTRGRRPTVRGNQAVPDLFGTWDEAIPGHLQLDTSAWDLRLLHPTKPGERVSLEVSILFDVASRQPVAMSTHPPGTSSDVLIDLLMQCLIQPDHLTADIGVPVAVELPHEAPRDRSVGLVGRPIPTVLVPDPEGRALPTLQPAMHRVDCATVSVDAGAAESSSRFHRIAGSLGISIVYSNKRTAHQNAFVERFHGTLHTMICEKLGGYTGGAVDKRGRRPDLFADHRPDEFVRHVLSWVHDIWRNRVVTYRDRFGFAAIDLSPNQYVALSRHYHGAPAKTVSLEDLILSMHMEERTADRGYIQLHKRRYRGPAVVEAARRSGSSLKSDDGNGRVLVAYPWKGSDFIYVLDRRGTGTWRRVAAVTARVHYDAPPAAEIYSLINNLDASAHTLTKEEADDLTFERSLADVGESWDLEEQLQGLSSTEAASGEDPENLPESPQEEVSPDADEQWKPGRLQPSTPRESYRWS